MSTLVMEWVMCHRLLPQAESAPGVVKMLIGWTWAGVRLRLGLLFGMEVEAGTGVGVGCGFRVGSGAGVMAGGGGGGGGARGSQEPLSRLGRNGSAACAEGWEARQERRAGE